MDKEEVLREVCSRLC